MDQTLTPTRLIHFLKRFTVDDKLMSAPFIKENRFPLLSQTWRIIVFFTNLIVVWAVFWLATGSLIPTGSGSSVWLLAMVAYWLLRLVTAPFFSPPKESIGIAVATLLLLAPLDFSSLESGQSLFVHFTQWSMVFAVFVGILGIIAVFRRDKPNSKLGRISFELAKPLGRGEILFTLPIIISVLGFFPNSLGWGAVILGLWTAEVAAHPVELFARLGVYVFRERTTPPPPRIAGSLIRVDAPNIVRISLQQDANWNRKAIHLVHLPNGEKKYVVPLFVQVQDREIVGTGLCCSTDDPISLELGVGNVCPVEQDGIHAKLSTSLIGEPNTKEVIGIVVEGSTIGNIKFQVLPESNLEEGMVVFANIRGKRVYYQILDANTKEEEFSSNPLGTQIASAAQIGHIQDGKGFVSFSWLPEMNQPLFLVTDVNSEQELSPSEFFIGNVPSTPFSVAATIDDIIEYHTAVLGMTGKGKTEFALEIVRQAHANDTKVLCVDFTGEYKARLSENNPMPIGLDVSEGTDFAKKLFDVETGKFGAPDEKRALQTFLDAISPKIDEQVEDFLTSSEHSLAILELAEIFNTKATIRTTELYLSAIMSWAKQYRKSKRILIVLEEAHTIIPETGGSGMDFDTKWVVDRIGQIALQGRKYGVGLLIVSQRTALVSKTILSQCNTYFTHGLVDRTSLEYLSNIYSQDHVKAIPNLKFLECIAFGKGVRSERPIIIKRNYDESIVTASRALDFVPEAEVEANQPENESTIEPITEIKETPEDDDDIPF